MVALSKSMVDVIPAGYQAHKGRHDTYNALNISSPCYVIVRCLKEETHFSKSFHKLVQENPIFSIQTENKMNSYMQSDMSKLLIFKNICHIISNMLFDQVIPRHVIVINNIRKIILTSLSIRTHQHS